MPLTDEELRQLIHPACEVWGKNNSVSDTYPDPDPLTGGFLINSDGVNFTISEWTHDSPQPTINDLKTLDLLEVETRRKSVIVDNISDRLYVTIDYLIDVEQRLSTLELRPRSEATAREYVMEVMRGKVPDITRK
jgi:hypothetical protein